MSNDSVAQDQIQAFYERWVRLEEEKASIGGDLKELFAEAKGNGFAPKALRESFRRVRDINDASQQEHDAVVDLYIAALTGARPTRTREGDDFYQFPADGMTISNTSSEHDADTGEVKKSTTTNGGDHETSERDPVIIQRRLLLDANIAAEQGTPAHDMEVRTRPANAVEEPGRSLASTNTPTESVEQISVPVHPSEAALLPQTGAVEALVDQSRTVNGASLTATKGDFPTSSAGMEGEQTGNHITDLTKPNPICRDPGDCGVYASWHLPCESCKRAAAERRAA